MFRMCLCFDLVSPSSSSLMSCWPNSDWTEVKVPPWISHSSKHKFTASVLPIKSVIRSFWCPGATSAIFITCQKLYVFIQQYKVKICSQFNGSKVLLDIGYTVNVLSVATSNYFYPLMFYLCLKLSINIQTISGTQSITGRDLTVTAVTQWVEVFSEHRKKVLSCTLVLLYEQRVILGHQGAEFYLACRQGSIFLARQVSKKKKKILFFSWRVNGSTKKYCCSVCCSKKLVTCCWSRAH